MELQEYFARNYSRVQRSGLTGLGNSWMDASLLRVLAQRQHAKVLELGASSGEFTAKVLNRLQVQEYFLTDIEPGNTNPNFFSALVERFEQNLTVAKANAESLQFEDDCFDLTFSTCLLAHVHDPSSVIREAIRVTKNGGHIIFLMPTDPGLMNQLVKRVITYPRMRRQGIAMPRYIYALGHVHPFHNLLARLRFECQGYRLNVSYRPFFLRSWNLNLWAIASIEKAPADKRR